MKLVCGGGASSSQQNGVGPGDDLARQAAIDRLSQRLERLHHWRTALSCASFAGMVVALVTIQGGFSLLTSGAGGASGAPATSTAASAPDTSSAAGGS